MEDADDRFMASGDYLAAVRDFAIMRGISAADLVEGSDLSYNELIDPPSLMPNLIVNKIGVNLYRQLENPIIDAVEFGLCMTASSHGSLGLAVQSAATLKEAYDILLEYYHTRINSQTLHIEDRGEYLELSITNEYKDESVDEGIKQFFDLATLITIATNTYYAIDKSDLEGAICLQIDSAEPERFPFEKLQGIDLEFNSETRCFTVPASWLVQPLSVANPNMVKAAVARCEQEMKRLSPMDLVSRIKNLLSDRQEQIPSLQELADQFHMSAATLKRKLKEHSTTYQDIKDQARLSRALELIQSGKENLDTIASKLGFSDASNFTKAFKKWTGKTPRAYQKETEEN